MLLRVLTRPFRTPAYWLLSFWTIVGWPLSELISWYPDYPVAVGGAIGLTLPLWYIAFGMLALHGHRLLLHEARGLEDEPIPEELDVNPFTYLRSLGYAYFFLASVVAVYSVGDSPNWLVVAIIASVLSVPWLGANLEGSVFGGLHPATLVRLVKGLKFDVVGHTVLVFIGLGSAAYAVKLNSFLFFALAGYLFLVCQALIGRLLYYRRVELDLFTERSPEQLREAEREVEERRRDGLFNELNTLCTTGRIQEAHEMLDEYIRDQYTILDPAMHERLLHFQDKRLTLEHGVRYLQRLLDHREIKQAWQVFKTCLEHDDRFRPFTDEAFIKVTRRAGKEDAELVAGLLADFDRAYPDSHLAANVKFRRARLLIELLGEEARGRKILDDIRDTHPEFAGRPEFQEYRR